jgi:HPt (histidine-containing phosphotransfer) domain-containing protein
MMTMEILHARFAARLSERLVLLDDLLGRLDSTRAIADAERLFHSLVGSGGTYGFPEITRVAREAEELCGRLKRRALARPEDIAALRALVDRLAELRPVTSDT